MRHSASMSLRRFCQTAIEVRAWMSNHILHNTMAVIIYPCYYPSWFRLLTKYSGDYWADYSQKTSYNSLLRPRYGFCSVTPKIFLYFTV